MKIDIEVLKSAVIRFGRVFVASFVAQLALELAQHSILEIVKPEDALQLLVVPCIAAGLAGLSKFLRDSSEKFDRLPV
jgi:hypothetical protein